eukprot:scaffold36410_cov65-Phaeocystis_antarctica.AAC.3
MPPRCHLLRRGVPLELGLGVRGWHRPLLGSRTERGVRRLVVLVLGLGSDLPSWAKRCPPGILVLLLPRCCEGVEHLRSPAPRSGGIQLRALGLVLAAPLALGGHLVRLGTPHHRGGERVFARRLVERELVEQLRTMRDSHLRAAAVHVGQRRVHRGAAGAGALSQQRRLVLAAAVVVILPHHERLLQQHVLGGVGEVVPLREAALDGLRATLPAEEVAGKVEEDLRQRADVEERVGLLFARRAPRRQLGPVDPVLGAVDLLLAAERPDLRLGELQPHAQVGRLRLGALGHLGEQIGGGGHWRAVDGVLHVRRGVGAEVPVGHAAHQPGHVQVGEEVLGEDLLRLVPELAHAAHQLLPLLGADLDLHARAFARAALAHEVRRLGEALVELALEDGVGVGRLGQPVDELALHLDDLDGHVLPPVADAGLRADVRDGFGPLEERRDVRLHPADHDVEVEHALGRVQAVRDELVHLLLRLLAGAHHAMRLVARKGAPVAEVQVDLVQRVGDVLPLAEHRRLHPHEVRRLELVELPVDLVLLVVDLRHPLELAHQRVDRDRALKGVVEQAGEGLQPVGAEQLHAVLEAAPLAHAVAEEGLHVLLHVLGGRGVVAVA